MWAFDFALAKLAVGRQLSPPDELLTDQTQTRIFKSVALIIAGTA